MSLGGDVVHEIIRLGGSFIEPKLSSVSWPPGVFTWSLERAKTEFSELNISTESELDEYFHPVKGLTFLMDDEGFWINWENDFEETDTMRFSPFAKDEAFYYFLDRRSSLENPDVYCVSHDAIDEAPYHPKQYKLRKFLRILDHEAE